VAHLFILWDITKIMLLQFCLHLSPLTTMRG